MRRRLRAGLFCALSVAAATPAVAAPLAPVRGVGVRGVGTRGAAATPQATDLTASTSSTSPTAIERHAFSLRSAGELAAASAGQLAPAATPGDRLAAQSLIIYLNGAGAQVRPAAASDARVNESTIASFVGAIPPFAGTTAQWDELTDCVADMFYLYNVTVVDTEPTGDDAYMEAVIGGVEADIREVADQSTVFGLAPFDGSCQVIDNAMVFVFAETGLAQGLSIRQLCEITAQEVAHAYGLDHELLPADPMSYLDFDGDRSFQDEAVPCGEFFEKDRCGERCAPTQNSHRMLIARVGPRYDADGAQQVTGGCATSPGPAATWLVLLAVGGAVSVGTRLRRRRLPSGTRRSVRRDRRR